MNLAFQAVSDHVVAVALGFSSLVQADGFIDDAKASLVLRNTNKSPACVSLLWASSSLNKALASSNSVMNSWAALVIRISSGLCVGVNGGHLIVQNEQGSIVATRQGSHKPAAKRRAVMQ